MYLSSALAQALVTVPVDSPAFVFSPGNWVGDAGRGGSVFRQTWNAGAYFRVTWTTTSTEPRATVLQQCLSVQRDRWGAAGASGASVVRVTGLQLDGGSAPGTAGRQPRWALEIGDSITEGIQANNGDDNLADYSYFVGQALQTQGYEYGVNACGYSGWLRPGDGTQDVPGYYVASGSSHGTGNYETHPAVWRCGLGGKNESYRTTDIERRAMNTTRRSFLQGSISVAGAAAALTVGGAAFAQDKVTDVAPDAATVLPPAPTTTFKGDMAYRDLGRTGEQVSLIGMGGFHIGKPDSDAEGVKLIHTGVDRGINFLDNSWDYNNGNSEVRMGKALSQGGYRQKVFLMTKIDGRTKASFESQIEQSLTRLQTDHLDLVQFHEIIRMEDPDRIFAKGGALEAALEAKQAGKVRFIGFTGHKDPLVHRRMLEVADQHDFHFDTVQMPINVMDAHFRSFTHQVAPLAVQKGIGILGMKTFGDHFILDRALADKLATPTEMLHYSMTMPVSVVVTGIDRMEILDQALEAARTYKPLSAAQITSLLARTQLAAADGSTELFKTTTHFDSTAMNPAWLG